MTCFNTEKFYYGFAGLYLKKCNEDSFVEESKSEESASNNELDEELYADLVKLDTRFGKNV